MQSAFVMETTIFTYSLRLGTKFAMGNATDTLKSLADEITQSVAEDGLANIMKNTRNQCRYSLLS